MTLPSADAIRALPAGRELDAMVAKLIMGWEVAGETYYWERLSPTRLRAVADCARWSPSTSWADAGPLLEELPPATLIELHDEGSTRHEGGSSSIDLIWAEGEGTATKGHVAYVYFDRTKPNDLCRAICVARILAALATGKGEQ